MVNLCVRTLKSVKKRLIKVVESVLIYLGAAKTGVAHYHRVSRLTGTLYGLGFKTTGIKKWGNISLALFPLY